MESTSVVSVAATATRGSSPPAAAEDIAALVSIRQAFDLCGIRIRSSKRADCPLCEGGSIGTMSYTGKLWHCFRCGRGGDVFTLVEQVRNYSFREALNFVANIAGVELANSAEVRRELAEWKKRREAFARAANRLSSLERSVLLQCRAKLHSWYRLRRNAGVRLAALHKGARPRIAAEEDVAWSALALVARQELRATAAYSIAAFGSEAERARFTLQPGERDEMIEAVLQAGFIEGDGGAITEVCYG